MRGLTMNHPHVPQTLRGKMNGLGCEAFVRHLTDLSVSALELLPIQYFANDRYLVDKGLSNYWGYQPLSYFAPAPHYLSEPDLATLDELTATVARLGSAGVEVLMDVCPKMEYQRLWGELSWGGVNSRVISSKLTPLHMPLGKV